MDYASRAKGFHNEAVAAGIPAITTAGIYPGVSNGKKKANLQNIPCFIKNYRKFSVLFFSIVPVLLL